MFSLKQSYRFMWPIVWLWFGQNAPFLFSGKEVSATRSAYSKNHNQPKFFRNTKEIPVHEHSLSQNCSWMIKNPRQFFQTCRKKGGKAKKDFAWCRRIQNSTPFPCYRHLGFLIGQYFAAITFHTTHSRNVQWSVITAEVKKVVRTSLIHSPYGLCAIFFVLTTFWRHRWSICYAVGILRCL